VNKIKTSVRADTNKIRAYLDLLVEMWPDDFPQPNGDGEPEAGRNGSENGAGPRFDEILMPGAAEGLSAQGPRVPLIDTATSDPDAAFYFRAAKQFLGGKTNAARMWAHIPHVAKLMVPFMVAILHEGLGGRLSTRLKLMAALKTSRVNESAYCLAQMTALGRTAGITDDLAHAIGGGDYMISPLLSPRERAAVLWAEHVAMYTAKTRDDIFEEVRKHYSDPEIVELTALCTLYNMMNRVYKSLRIPIETGDAFPAKGLTVRVEPDSIRNYIQELTASWPASFPVPNEEAPALL
jgi:alkylhydroperoxidase family enzyme